MKTFLFRAKRGINARITTDADHRQHRGASVDSSLRSELNPS